MVVGGRVMFGGNIAAISIDLTAGMIDSGMSRERRRMQVLELDI